MSSEIGHTDQNPINREKLTKAANGVSVDGQHSQGSRAVASRLHNVTSHRGRDNLLLVVQERISI